MIELEKIRSLHIEWFGGEPFMGYKNVILPLSSFAKDLCEKHNIPFYNTATTNGFFISEEKYSSMSDILMNGFQITLDGERNQNHFVVLHRISRRGDRFHIADPGKGMLIAAV